MTKTPDATVTANGVPASPSVSASVAGPKAYAEAQWSTESARADIRNMILGGSRGPDAIEAGAQYLCKTLRVANIRKCRELVRAACEESSGVVGTMPSSERPQAERDLPTPTERVEGPQPTTATVTRAKQYMLPGQNRRFAWRWIYTVSILGKPPIGAGDLSEVAVSAKANGATKIVKTWLTEFKFEESQS